MDRRRAATFSWDALVADSGRFENLGSYFDQPAGYPEWLVVIASEIAAASEQSTDRLTG